MSAPVFVKFNTTAGNTALNAEHIVSIKREENHTNLMIHGTGGSVMAMQVKDYPSEVVRQIDDVAKSLPSAFRAAALFIELEDKTVYDAPAVHTYFNVGKIASFSDKPNHTDLQVGGMGTRKVQESEHIIGQKINEALTLRLANA